MSSKNYYDVTKWNVGNPYEDIGESTVLLRILKCDKQIQI